MAFEITGKIIDISPVNQVSDKFKKREFVIEKKETGGEQYLLTTSSSSLYRISVTLSMNRF